MKNNVSAAIVGFVFALGLGISGMTQPEKVVGFLDIMGNWNPALMFVMAGAILVHSVSYKLIRKKQSPLFSEKWHVPDRRDVTPALVVGSTIFGIGWGLGGYCPGPAVTSLASLHIEPMIFVASMAGGMIAFRILDKKIGFKK